MPFVSVTRLRIRSWLYLPLFALDAVKTVQQVRVAAGFQDGALLPDHDRTFWTMTAWDNGAAMRSYMLAGAHKASMPKLMHWCDEASVVHWEQDEPALPRWEEADRRMRTEGRISKVKHPSATHAGLRYLVPRVTRSAPIRPKAAAGKWQV